MPKLVSVKKMIAIEQAQVTLGTSLEKLMRNAGLGLAMLIDRSANVGSNARKVIALVGSGNNGGDALVAITHLATWGWDCVAWIIGKRDTEEGLIKEASQAGAEILWQEPQNLREFFNNAVLLDGILGTGFKLPLRADLHDLMSRIKDAIQTTTTFVYAVDCPSGVDCDSGEMAGSVIPADMTVCMAALKKGMLNFPAATVIGQVETIAIGITEDNFEWKTAFDEVLDNTGLKSLLPARELNAHKGSFGKVLISGGCIEYPGAPVLSGKGAYSVGAGLVRIATTSITQKAFASSLPEAVWAILPDEGGYLSSKSVDVIKGHINDQNAFLFGPGLGSGEITQAYAGKIIDLIQKMENAPRMVIDADGLRAVAKIPNWYQMIPSGSVITPHPGEFRAIKSDLSISDLDRVESAKLAAKTWHCVVVLKGAMTVVAEPSGKTTTVPLATSALAKAGTGDVLAGMVAGLLAQGMDSYDAAIAGVALHALAGIAAAEGKKNDRSVMASDLRLYIGIVLQNLGVEAKKLAIGLGV